MDIRALRETVKELQRQGVKCELLEKAQPRMYYEDQLQRQLGQSSEICDYVLNLKDSWYDVGFIKQTDGSYLPVFDDFRYSPYPTTYGSKPVAQILGCDPKDIKEKMDAKEAEATGDWGSDTVDPTTMACSISKLLQGYSKNTAILTAQDNGYMVEDALIDEEGNIELVLQV
jgi:hypothetical protein